jgi:hypothetical protein
MGIATLPTIEEIRNRWAERGQLAGGAWHPRHTLPDDGRTDLVADMCARDVAVLLAEVERLRAASGPTTIRVDPERDPASVLARRVDVPALVAEVERLRAEPSASCELFIAGRKVELPAALPTTVVESFIRAFWGKDRVDELLCWVEDGMPSPYEWELRDR